MARTRRKKKTPPKPKPPDVVETGTRIRARRLQLGLKQRDVQFPGCTYSYLARIESGDRRPQIEVLEGLAEKLDCTVEWLRTGEDELSMTLGREEWTSIRALLDYEVREGVWKSDRTVMTVLLDMTESLLQVQHPEHPISQIYEEVTE